MGIILSALLMNLVYGLGQERNVERIAREMGMVYPGEVRVLETEPEEVEQ